MRKDVRAGVAIGGILIAVLVVYAVVNSRTQSPKKADQVVIDGDKTAGAGDNASAGDHVAAAPESTPASADHIDATSAAPTAPAPSMAPDAPTVPPTVSVPSAPVAIGPAHADAAPGAAVVPQAQPTKPAPAAAETLDPAERHRRAWASYLTADHIDSVGTAQSITPSGDPDNALVDGEPMKSAHRLQGDAAPSSDDAVVTPHPSHISTPPSGDVESPVEHPSAKTYVVKSGDTFMSISKSVYGESRYYKQILKANPSIDPSRLRVGATIKLPDQSVVKQHTSSESEATATSTHTAAAAAEQAHHASARKLAAVNPATEYRVQSSDSLYRISMKLYHTPNKVDAIYQLNKDLIGPDPARLKLNMVLKLPASPEQPAVQ